jgi:DNA-binding NarL/FixJ family response regulator
LKIVRVLVVDDYKPWRLFVSSALQKHPELRIVGEVSDGLEAVGKALELKPDLILLDIGLPTLSGIEAARRVHRLAPASKILFVSQDLCADMAREAPGTGARGYIIKARAWDLVSSVQSVLAGQEVWP